jgi:predicted kinase
MKILIGVAGLPGSGKTTLLDLFDRMQVHVFDDINRDWGRGIEAVKDRLSRGQSVVVSDIFFCQKRWRTAFEDAVGMKAQWICFENNPEKARKNATKRNRRCLDRELDFIEKLTKTFEYEPFMIYEETDS